jgi:hypothetical protein
VESIHEVVLLPDSSSPALEKQGGESSPAAARPAPAPSASRHLVQIHGVAGRIGELRRRQAPSSPPKMPPRLVKIAQLIKVAGLGWSWCVRDGESIGRTVEEDRIRISFHT